MRSQLLGKSYTFGKLFVLFLRFRCRNVEIVTSISERFNAKNITGYGLGAGTSNGGLTETIAVKTVIRFC